MRKADIGLRWSPPALCGATLPDGTLDRTITLPCSNPTKPAFGGAALDTLYVTSTKMVIKPDAPGAEANGGLFAVKPGVCGIAESLFAD